MAEVLNAQVPGVLMPPTPQQPDADNVLRCSATVWDLGEMGEPDILIYVRHCVIVRALRTGQSTQDLFKGGHGMKIPWPTR